MQLTVTYHSDPFVSENKATGSALVSRIFVEMLSARSRTSVVQALALPTKISQLQLNNTQLCTFLEYKIFLNTYPNLHIITNLCSVLQLFDLSRYQAERNLIRFISPCDTVLT
jgi:hypothetical protein